MHTAAFGTDTRDDAFFHFHMCSAAGAVLSPCSCAYTFSKDSRDVFLPCIKIIC